MPLQRWKIKARIEHINSGRAYCRAMEVSATNRVQAMYLIKEMFRESAERLIRVESVKLSETRMKPRFWATLS